ncbi:MAG: filamentous hemagglutinin N-terminal domain-containing protein, partial [Campylobacter sp.]|nr:filamentous hemagglutinin N-terminal domain-containing protein [Campylobacter sp.]
MQKNNKKLKFIDKKGLISLSVSVSLIFPNFIFADIIADPNAPMAHQPTVLRTPNNAVQVDITKPTSKGVSVNEFSKFDTSNDGTVLNNSRINTNTKIGGPIQANPRLTGSSAKLIVNKVNSNDKSTLSGNIEIAGHRADLLIANPSGINVDGANFINSKSTTLTTGNLNFENDALKDISVNKGEISVNGRGLKDESDYLNILSNSAKINAKIYANEINVKTGQNSFNQKGEILSTTNKATNENFSIDTSALGGMYANKIKLLATKDGVGVNNAGEILANDIDIDVNGELTNTNQITSINQASIKTKAINNKAQIASANSLNINTSKLRNSKDIYASKKAVIKTQSLDNKDGSIGADLLDIKTDTYTNHGLLSAKNDLNLEVNNDDIDYKGGFYARRNLNIKTNKKFTNNAEFLGKENLNIKAKETINNNLIFAKNINIDSKDTILNQNDQAKIYSGNDININTKSLSNINDAKIVAENDLSIKNDKSTNNKTELIENSSSYIYAGNNININAELLKNNSLDKLDIKTTSHGNTLNLMGGYQISLSDLDFDNMRADIIREYEINHNYEKPNPEYVKEALKQKVINSVEELYVLNLHKDTKAEGKNIYDSIEIDYDKKIAKLPVSHIKSRERERNVVYNITKQYIDKDDMASFRQGVIASANDIKFDTDKIINDKSIVYAGNDINLINTHLENIGLELTHDLNAYANYIYKKKNKVVRRAKHGKYSDRRILGSENSNIHNVYTEIGYPAIFAAEGKITGKDIYLQNGSFNDNILAQNAPSFKSAYSNLTLLYDINQKNTQQKDAQNQESKDNLNTADKNFIAS